MSITPGRILYLTRRRLKFGWRHWWAERFVQHRIHTWRPNPEHPLTEVPVHTLASIHDWNMALWMLASLHEAAERRWRVVLHEDGSLSESEFDVFRRLFPGIKIVTRKDADDAMAGILAEFPNCADYRRRMPHGLKCFDIPHLADSPRFLMIDPDVLFFRYPTELLRWVDDETDLTCWFNQDFQEPSPIPPEQACQELKIDLWPRVNSGLSMLTRNTVMNLQAMEQWLRHPLLQNENIQWRVEQTLLALAASRTNRGGLLPSGYEVSHKRHRSQGCIARHYVGCVREQFYSEGLIEWGRRMPGCLMR